MLDSRNIASGVQAGRSLAGNGPPIQEMLGMKMQQNQAIAEIMKELLKAHMSDMSDLRKSQLDYYFKAKAKAAEFAGDEDPTAKAQFDYWEKYADEILKKDFSRWGGFKGTLTGFGGEDTTGGGGTGGGADFLKPTAEVSTPAKPTIMNRISNAAAPVATPVMRGMGQAAVAPFQAMTAGVPAGVDAMLKGLRGPRGAGAPVSGKDKYGHTIGEMYRGYKYIGNNQWQK